MPFHIADPRALSEITADDDQVRPPLVQKLLDRFHDHWIMVPEMDVGQMGNGRQDALLGWFEVERSFTWKGCRRF
jgi:hypothetical protein